MITEAEDEEAPSGEEDLPSLCHSLKEPLFVQKLLEPSLSGFRKTSSGMQEC